MIYQFPKINNISDILPAIAGKEEFIIADRPGFKVVNYLVQFENTFENPMDEGISEQEKLYRTIRRECRGIIFDEITGDIIRRPFNKFFNLNIPTPHVIKYSTLNLSVNNFFILPSFK